jgi:Zn-finger nucleic acid-binding protein
MPQCPLCHVSMVPVEESGVTAASCPNCRGTWISGKALERRARMEGWAIPGTVPNFPALPDLADTVTHSNTTAPLTCPDCRQVMTKDRFHPMIPVQIDRCDACGYIWLDAGELDLLLRLYRELTTANDDQIAAKRQRIERLEQIQRHPDLKDVDHAVDVGITVVSVLVNLLAGPYIHQHHRRW